MTDVTAPTPGDRLRAALATNGRTTPDAVAAAQNRARQVGAPRGALTYVPPTEWPEPQQNFDIDEFLRRSPRTANYLSNVDNAQVAGDPESRDNLASLEDRLRAPVDPIYRSPERNSRRSTDTLVPLRRENTPGNWLRGIVSAVSAGEAWTGQQVALGDALGLWRNPAERETAQRQYNQATAQVAMDRPDIQGNFASGVYGGVESIARQAPGLALSVLLRNPAPSLAVAGAQTGGQAYGKYSARGATGAEAAAGAAGEAGVEVLTELIPMGRLIGALGAPAAKKFIIDLGISTLADIPGEQIATLAQDAIDTAIANPDKTWGDYLKERPDAAAQTLVASVTQSLLLSGGAAGLRATGAFVDRQEQQATRAEMDAATIGNIVENATNSPLRARSPETFQEFVAQAAEGGPVTDLYISAEALNQSGVDIAALRAAVPSVDQQIEQAARDGGDVRIPVEEFAAKGVEVEGADTLVDHMRINPALPSRAEVSALADGQAAELQAQAQQVLADATVDDAFRQSAERVETGFYDQLQAAGRFTKDVNRSYASLVGNFYTVQAKRLGITPEQMAERYPLKITADLPQANRPATLDQTPENYDLGAARDAAEAEARDVRANRAAFSEDVQEALHHAASPLGILATKNGRATASEGVRAAARVGRWDLVRLIEERAKATIARDRAWAADGPSNDIKTKAVAAAEDAYLDIQAAVDEVRAERGTQTTLDQGPSETLEDITADAVAQGVRLDASETEDAVELSVIDTTPVGRGQGLGTAFMERMTSYADATGKRMLLTPDAGFGASSRGRLVKFYKRFGFVENKGRTRDFSTRAGMIREPTGARALPTPAEIGETNREATPEGFDASAARTLADAQRIAEGLGAEMAVVKSGSELRLDTLSGEQGAVEQSLKVLTEYADQAGLETTLDPSMFAEPVREQLGSMGFEFVDESEYPDWMLAMRRAPRVLLNQSEVRPHPAFYSALLRAVAKAPQAKASAAQWKATLAKTPGVKKDEIEWSGLNEWLDIAQTEDGEPLTDAKGNIPREQIVAFLENGGVQVEETLLASTELNPDSRFNATAVMAAVRGATDRDEAIMQLENDGTAYRVLQTRYPDLFVEENGDEVEDWAGIVVDDLWRPPVDADGPAVFSTYKLPGADDTYRELLLTLPRIDGPSTHWDQPNVVAHTRFTARTDASGARVLFLEEMQSDWHQKGRDRGYMVPAPEEERAAAEDLYQQSLADFRSAGEALVAAARARAVWPDVHKRVYEFFSLSQSTSFEDLPFAEQVNVAGASLAYLDDGQTSTIRNQSTELQAVNSAYQSARLAMEEARIGRSRAEGEQGIPDAPFRTSWAQLVMKRMIAYAVENGFDKIAWINGNQQNGGQTGGDGSFFYERNLVNSTNDLLKKLGGRVERVDFRSPKLGARKILDDLAANIAESEARTADPVYLAARGLDPAVVAMRLDIRRRELAEAEASYEASTARPENDLGIQNGFVITDQMKAQAADGFALFQQNRGQIAFGQDITQTPSVISLLRTADLSTFLHETGHFFLEVTRDMASREDAPPEIKQDFDTLLSWFGVADAAAWQAMPFEDKRKYHEQFARGFEAFLFEGRAPTPALRELFQRFRSWLLNVYRSLTALNVQLTDDVRSVMGRMVASQDEIVEANAEYGFTPLAEKPPYMDAASWADYQGAFFAATEEGVDTLSTRAVRDMKWLSNARSKALRRLQNEARLQRRAVKAEVTEEVQAEPVNRARAYLRRGVGPDGEPVPGALKLDRAALEAAYGTEPNAIWRSLRTGGKYGEVQTDGVDPDVAAEMFGYESGDALVRDLVTAEPPQEKIAGLTDQRMLERYGDMADAAGVERAADEAVANDAHIRAIATDYAALATATGQPRALAAAAREHAARIVNSIPLKRLKPAQFFAAMTRAGKAADKAAKAGDLVLAATHRRNQLINLQAAKYALEARAEVDKGLTRFQRIVSANDEALTRSRDMALVNAARAILNLYGFGRVKNDPAAYLDRVKAYDPQLYADIQPFVEGARGGAKPLDLITYEQFQGLRDTVNQLWALSLRTRQIELDGRLVDIKVAQAALSARLDEIGVSAPVGQDQAPTEGQKFSRGIQGARAALRRVESWARGVDAADRGPFRSFIWNPVSTAADRYRIAQADYIRQFLALVEPIKGTLKNKKIAAPEIGYTFSGKAELLHAVLHSGNTSNLSKLLLGRRWGKQTEDGALDTTRWDAFLERAWAEGVLTKEDYDFAQGVWDLLESTKPAAQAAHRAMYGRYFSEVTAQPVQTPWGVYAGGYVPATTDSFMVQDAQLRQEQEALEDSNAFMFPAASNGFTKSRVEDYTRELSLDIRLLPMHLDKVLKFTHLGPPVRDVARVLRGREFAAKLNAFDPVVATDLLLPWLQRSARQVVSEPTKGWGGKHLDAFFREARSRAGMQIMFGNFSNVLQQFTSFSNAATRVRPAKIASGLWGYVRDPKGSREEVDGLSDFMRNRANSQVFEMRQSIEQILLDANGLDKLRDFAARHAYFLQQALQNVTDVAVWRGAFDQAVERGDDDLEAVRFADSVIRETQGSLSPEDISRFETGTPFVRFFTQFYSYFNNQANMLGTEGLVVARTAGVKNGMGRLLYVYLMGYAVPALLGQAIADLMRGGWEDDEDDGYLDEFLNWFFMSQVKFGLAAVPIIGTAANAAIGGFTPATYDDRVSVSPAISMFDASLALPGTYYEAVVEGEGLKSKDVRDTMNMLGLISGLPVGALGRPTAYAYGVATDQIEPTSTADAARGVVTGTASPGSRVQ